MKKNSWINKYKNIFIILLIIVIFHFFYIEHFNEEDNLIDSGRQELDDFIKEFTKNQDKTDQEFIQDSNTEETILNSANSYKKLLEHYDFTTYSSLIRYFATDWRFWWISTKMQSTWPIMKKASIERIGSCPHHKGIRKNILFMPGFLTLTNFATKRSIRYGGPMGELNCLADLMNACLALCHKVIVKVDIRKAAYELRALKGTKPRIYGCSAENEIDIIFTDIMGYRALPSDITDAYKNKFRIIDMYGTEAIYNDVQYNKERNIQLNSWAGLNLHLKQFYTMFPHTPENTQLGFVLFKKSKVSEKQKFSLIIGKEGKYLQDKRQLLETIQKIVPIKATLHTMYSKLFPKGSELLGTLSSEEYEQLLETAKICIGLGHPIESPSPIQALSAGCIYLNPLSNYTLNGKPTRRSITSQHTYLERYFKPPYVYTYDPTDLKALENILYDIVHETQEIKPLKPWIFTIEGYLKQLNHNLINHDYCSNQSTLEDNHKTGRQYFLSETKLDCKDFCYKKGLICDFDGFSSLNSQATFEKLNLPCDRIETSRITWSPAYHAESRTCHLQPFDNPLYSCSSSFDHDKPVVNNNGNARNRGKVDIQGRQNKSNGSSKNNISNKNKNEIIPNKEFETVNKSNFHKVYDTKNTSNNNRKSKGFDNNLNQYTENIKGSKITSNKSVITDFINGNVEKGNNNNTRNKKNKNNNKINDIEKNKKELSEFEKVAKIEKNGKGDNVLNDGLTRLCVCRNDYYGLSYTKDLIVTL